MTDGSGGLEGAKAAERGTPRPSLSTAKSFLPDIYPAGSLFPATGWYQQRGLGNDMAPCLSVLPTTCPHSRGTEGAGRLAECP